MKNMKKNDKMLLIVFISIFVFVACIGISYAYYTAVIDRGEESASVVSRAGNLEITYTDGSKQIIGRPRTTAQIFNSKGYILRPM